MHASSFHCPLNKAAISAYIKGVPSGTMMINAHVISGSDPGAVPGGSTKILHLGIMGPKQDRRTSKGVALFRLSATVIGENCTIANDNRAPVAMAA